MRIHSVLQIFAYFYISHFKDSIFILEYKVTKIIQLLVR